MSYPRHVSFAMHGLYMYVLQGIISLFIIFSYQRTENTEGERDTDRERMASYFCISVMAVLLLLATAAAVEREAAEEQKTKHTNTGGTAAEDEESWGTWAKEKISGGLGFKHQPQEDSYAGPLSLSLCL